MCAVLRGWSGGCTGSLLATGIFKLRARDERLTPVSDGYKLNGREQARSINAIYLDEIYHRPSEYVVRNQTVCEDVVL